MKKAAIATISIELLLTNYGSFFQHYALRNVLKSFGFEAFRLKDGNVQYTNARILIERLKDIFRPIIWLVRRLPKRRELAHWLAHRNKSFWMFSRDYEKIIGCLNESQIIDDNTIGVRGGDQVCHEDSDERWFSNIRMGNPKFTYAISADWERMANDPQRRQAIAARLNAMTAIAVREKRGVKIIQSLLREDLCAAHVADPVMLLTGGDFRKIQVKERQFFRPTLFCYLLNIYSAEDMCLGALLKLSERLGCDLRIVGIQGAEMFIPKHLSLFPSPLQFLKALDDAKYFITNSYHGSVLALLYGKPFLSVWQHCPPGTDQNERQRELMRQFHLENHWVDYRLSVEDLHKNIVDEIDWPCVNETFERLRKTSLGWLEDTLKLKVSR